MKVKEENEKAGLKLNIQKTKIMVSGPITSWQIAGGNVETVTDLIFLGSQITADGDCSHEIKRPLLLGRKPVISDSESLSVVSPWTIQSRELSRVFSGTSIQSIFGTQPSYGPALTSGHDYCKDRSFDSTALCWQSDVSVF